MNTTRIRINLFHVLFASAAIAAAGSPSTYAADYFEQQRQLTDGAVPVRIVPRITKPETAIVAAENDWITRSRVYTSTPQKMAPVAEPRLEAQAMPVSVQGAAR